ncbi:MAG: signal peptidase II [bacterium]
MVNRLCLILFASIIILLDQITKVWVSNNLILGQKIFVFKNFISFIFVRNTGAAFSLFAQHTQLLSLFSAIVAVSIIIYFLKKRGIIPFYNVIGWSLILGGTLGNLADRVRLGFVIDFIKLDIINSPVFNIADVAINIGAFIILMKALINISNEKHTKQEDS